MLFIFSIRHLWQLTTVVFLHWCIICDAPLFNTSYLVWMSGKVLNLVDPLNAGEPDCQVLKPHFVIHSCSFKYFTLITFLKNLEIKSQCCSFYKLGQVSYQ